MSEKPENPYDMNKYLDADKYLNKLLKVSLKIKLKSRNISKTKINFRRAI